VRSRVAASLSWIQIRDAIAEPSAWRRGRAVGVDGPYIGVVPDDGFNAGEIVLLESRRGPQVRATLARWGLCPPGGGPVALWSPAASLLALPLSDLCECRPDEVAIDRRAVIGQRAMTSTHRPHRYELIAEDGTWTCALFAAVDTSVAAREDAARAEAEAAARADREARAGRRTDRSVQGVWLRSSLKDR
jgi:hypothetical protein